MRTASLCVVRKYRSVFLVSMLLLCARCESRSFAHLLSLCFSLSLRLASASSWCMAIHTMVATTVVPAAENSTGWCYKVGITVALHGRNEFFPIDKQCEHI